MSLKSVGVCHTEKGRKDTLTHVKLWVSCALMGGGAMLVQQLPKTQLLKQYGSFVSFQEDMHAG
jgi:hypothetical protein